MSSRGSETYIAAIDTNGEAHFVAYTYDYSCGTYHSITQLGDRVYEVEADCYELNVIRGEKLPRLVSEDLSSFFTEKPTTNMAKAIELAGLEEHSIAQLIFVFEDFVGPWVNNLWCYSVSAAEVRCVDFDTTNVPEEVFGDSVEDIFNDIFAKGIDGYAAYLDSVREK